jgi:2-hydroxycyclohexanecarboxyl-CoA dehydrogenase
MPITTMAGDGEFSLARSVAVVTGGASGIGAALAQCLSERGALVGIIDKDIDVARAQVEALPGDAIAAQADVSNYQSVARAARDVTRRLGPCRLLVNNAGWDRMEPFADNAPGLWDRLLDVNVKGVLNTTHAVLPALLEAPGSRIINVASDAGRVGSSGEVAYSACKGAVIAFTKALAREVARHQVAVNCVCPGPTDTPLLQEMLHGEAGDRIISAMVKATPFRRLATADEVARAAVLLASMPAFVTGQVLSVSGGLTMAG